MKQCSVESCGKPAKGRGWCSTHWRRWRIHGSPTAPDKRTAPERCSIEGCVRPARNKGWCLRHFRRWEEHGAPIRPPKPEPPACSAEGCEQPASTASLCSSHYSKKVRDRAAPCRVEGCANRKSAHGLCGTHLYRLRRYGDPLVVRQVQGDLTQRLLSHIDQRGEDQCWPWTSTISPTGYGMSVKPGGGSTGVHRLVYQAFVGEIPEGQDIDHLCHLPEACVGGPTCPHRRCCNPRHLAPEEPVANTMRGNSPSAINARKTHCQNGHEFNQVNTYVNPKGHRTCRPCKAAYKQRRRAAGLSA